MCFSRAHTDIPFSQKHGNLFLVPAAQTSQLWTCSQNQSKTAQLGGSCNDVASECWSIWGQQRAQVWNILLGMHILLHCQMSVSATLNDCCLTFRKPLFSARKNKINKLTSREINGDEPCLQGMLAAEAWQSWETTLLSSRILYSLSVT